MIDDYFNIELSDLTMLECDGEYKSVCDLMSDEVIKGREWTVASSLTIEGPAGLAFFEIDFNNDGKTIITGYKPSINDALYNTDISCLSAWICSKGWKIPELSIDVVAGDTGFWRYFWEMNLVDSEYLDIRYGSRNR